MPPPRRPLGGRLLAAGPQVSLSLDHAALAARFLLQHHVLHLGGVGGRHPAVRHLQGGFAPVGRRLAAPVGLDRRVAQAGHSRRRQVCLVEGAYGRGRRRRDWLPALDHLDDLVRLPTQVAVRTKRVVPAAVRAEKQVLCLLTGKKISCRLY